jgi:thiol:disulfide interchange protein DsbD
MKIVCALFVVAFFSPAAFAVGKGKLLAANADLKPVIVHEQAWLGDLATAIEQAAKEKKPVFIDFTGVTCLNCKINEKNIFPKPEVKELFAKYVRVQLYTDTVPEEFYTKAPAEEVREKHAASNQDFQKKIFSAEQLPYYVIVKPDGEGGFVIVGTYDEGKINKLAAFVEFLKKSLGEK